jgi:molybdopterin-guanine dinucleotide biosynthesis protein A
MDNVIKPTDKSPTVTGNGVFVRGVIVSNRAKAFKRKDGSGVSVIVEHEIATQPGVAIWTLYFDPKLDTTIRVDGDKVIEFPKMKEFQQVTIKANRVRFDEHTGQLIIKSGEIVQ